MKRKIVGLTAILALLTLAGCGSSSSSSSSLTQIGGSSSSSSSAPNSSTAPTAEDVDIVGQTKIRLNDAMFDMIMAAKDGASYQASLPDFNRDGIERMLTTSDYAPNSADDVFTNYVDGDTTQFTSYNGLYTVKVRYLGVDTPESTSEIEEWGKSASLFNQSRLKNAKHVIVQSAASAMGVVETDADGKATVVPTYGAADLDTYQRSLAYVWYTDKENPTKDDFRNLNLELVYEGYSLFSGSMAEMCARDEKGNYLDTSFYDAFTLASQIAQQYKKGMYSGETDEHYWYGDPVTTLTLADLYNTDYYEQHEDGRYSMYCDEKTRYTFEGVVSRKVGNAFYIQDTYDKDDPENSTYGLYVFTNKYYAPVQVGNRIRISGVLSYYGGAYELTGLSYSFFNPRPGDIEYVDDANGNHITEELTPIKATAKEIHDGKYQAVLVELVDEKGEPSTVYFNHSGDNTYGNLYSYGGTQEYNTYNETYPFYNTDNDIVLYGKADEDMDYFNGSFQTLLADPQTVRMTISGEALITGDYTSDVYTNTDGTTNGPVVTPNQDVAVTSYQYYTGGLSCYIPGNHIVTDHHPDGKEVTYSTGYAKEAIAAQEALEKGETPSVPEGTKLYATTYARKKITGVTGIAIHYVSTGGNAKYSINVCDAADLGTISEVENG